MQRSFIHCVMFLMAAGTNYYKLEGLNNRKWFFHCSGVQNQGASRTALLLEGRVFPLPLTPSAVAADTSWLVITLHQSLPSSSHHLLLCMSNLPLPLSYEGTCVVVFRAHLDNSGLSPLLKTLKLITL